MERTEFLSMEKLYHVIIINYNSTKYTIECIESILRINANRNVNVVVVDNASEDMPTEIVNKFPKIKYLENDKNIGFAKGVNLAFKQVSAEFVLLLNPDTILMEGFFDTIYDFMMHNTDLAIVGPAILESNGDLQGSARKFPTALTSLFGRKSPITKWFPNNSITKSEFTCFTGNGKPIEVDWVSGACMIIRRAAFESVGGFDENLFLYWEDADLCKRLREKGWRIVYYPQARIRHLVGQSSNSRPVVSIAHFHYSCYKYFLKHTHGFWRLCSPFVFSGLTLRCAFVIFLNLIEKKGKRLS
jgi:hypothetical protein